MVSIKKSSNFAPVNETQMMCEIEKAEIAQLVEHDLAKVGVASSSLVFRSNPDENRDFFYILLGTIELLIPES